MKDITMTVPGTAIVADKRADVSVANRLVQALREQTEAQNRIADQLEELNDRLGAFEAMMYAHMRANSISLDDIDQSLSDIADNIR